jgi:uncharacterized protein (TIGR00106 family)
MHASVELCLVPVGVDVSVSRYVVACEEVLREAGFDPELHDHGTNFAGEWDAVMAAVQRCHEVVHEMGAVRIASTLKIDTRTDRVQMRGDKTASVRRSGPRLS